MNDEKTYEHDYLLIPPLNYSTDIQSEKKYPLIVFIHGSGSSGSAPDFLSNDDFKKTYPSFIYLPHSTGSWNNEKLIKQIEEIIHSYSIDTDRIYLIGYSMGGSATFSLADDYYAYNGRLFAGIIRLAGMSQIRLSNDVIAKTSIWLHLGAKDKRRVLQSTGGAFLYLLTHNIPFLFRIKPIRIPDHHGTTFSLVKKTEDKVKLSIYENTGHGISTFPFEDPYLLEWLFKQSL